MLVAAFVAGCGDDAPAVPAAPVVLGNGTVRGTVTFVGTPPAAQRVEGKSCHAGAEPIEVTPVVVNDQGRLKDVVVFVKSVTGRSDGKSLPPVVLDQVSCVYVPHAVALRVGQTLRVTSSDPTLHNVHGTPSANRPFNFGMTAAGDQKNLTFEKPESFKVRCDVHPWMSASVNVFAHPFYAVTGADGAFEIGRLPPGEHTLVFRHDVLGDVEQTVTVTDGQTAEYAATFGKRAAQ